MEGNQRLIASQVPYTPKSAGIAGQALSGALDSPVPYTPKSAGIAGERVMGTE